MVPQSEVIRAIVSGYSPCYGVPLLPHRHAALSVPTGPAAHEVDQHLVRVGGPLADEEGERAAVRTGGPACWAHAAAHARRWAQETKARWGWQLDARSSGGAGACLCAVHTRQARTCARHGGGGRVPGEPIGGQGGEHRHAALRLRRASQQDRRERRKQRHSRLAQHTAQHRCGTSRMRRLRSGLACTPTLRHSDPRGGAAAGVAPVPMAAALDLVAHNLALPTCWRAGRAGN